MHNAANYVIAIGLLAVIACDMKLEDRCPDGFEYDTKHRFCLEVDEDDSNGSSNGNDKDTSVEDASDNDSGTDISGLGDSCSSSEQCDGLEASYCAYNPVSQTGYCTTAGCISDGCPETYICCDCTEVESFGVSACLTPTDAEMVPMVGCTCEGD